MSRYPHPTFGWDPVKLSDLSLEQLNDLRLSVAADPANRNPDRKSIFLHTKAAMRKTDALAWAVYHKQRAAA